ncbi:MAG: YlmC/YmxH family sporulation protein [Clostridiales bacterium]|nr:YlmC/YmxH family sporulation protein [Clostridiales bacterium]
MNCRVTQLRAKEIVNIKDGSRLGSLCDIELDTRTGQLISIIVYGESRFMGLLGRDDDIVIPWDKINIIGDDTILVTYDAPDYRTKKQGYFDNMIK